MVDGFASVSSKRESLPLAQSSSPVALQSTVFEASDSFSCSDGTAINNRHSASDWLYNIKSLPNSKVLTEIKKPVLAVAGWSVFVSVAHAALACSSNASWRSLATRLCIPATAHSFLVSALGLLLVFRTNSSYQRFYVSVQGCLSALPEILSHTLTARILELLFFFYHRRDERYGRIFSTCRETSLV